MYLFLSFQTHLKRHIIDITKQVKVNTLENCRFNTYVVTHQMRSTEFTGTAPKTVHIKAHFRNKVASMSFKWCLFDKTEQRKEKARSMDIISSLFKA